MDWDETVARVRRAAAFCVEAGLERFRIEEDALTIEIRRRSAPVPVAAQPEPAPAGAHPGLNGSASREAIEPQVLRAEFVGVVRLSRPAVSEGAEVEAGRELAYVESLGIRNPVRAANPGRVAVVYVGDGEPVEYGQPLFALEATS